MKRGCFSYHKTAAHRFNVIDVDFYADAERRALIDAVVGRSAADCLCQGAGGAAMEDAHGLHRSCIDGHGSGKIVVADFDEFDKQMVAQALFSSGVDLVESDWRVPNWFHVHKAYLFFQICATIRRMNQRLFFAIETMCPWPETFPPARLLSEEHRHMTLVFLGETDSDALLACLPLIPDPSFKIGLAGCFDAPLFLPESRPRTAGWHVRLFEGQDLLTAFRQKLLVWLSETNFIHRFDNNFLPHVTIARDPEDLVSWRCAFTTLPLYLRNIHLYRSLGHSKYESLWRHPILPPFEELEHTADIAFLVRGEDWKSLHLHASLALAFQFPPLLPFIEIKREPKDFVDLVAGLNELVSKADAEIGCPFKAVSFHGDVQMSTNGIWEWEMIVDV